MQIERKEIVIGLPGLSDIKAKIVIRNEQRIHSESEEDRVAIRWEIQLPVDQNYYLDPRIRFGERAKVMGHDLDTHWGCKALEGGNYRYETRWTYAAPTIKSAFSLAEVEALEAIKPLIDALTARQAALVAADIED